MSHKFFVPTVIRNRLTPILGGVIGGVVFDRFDPCFWQSWEFERNPIWLDLWGTSIPNFMNLSQLPEAVATYRHFLQITPPPLTPPPNFWYRSESFDPPQLPMWFVFKNKIRPVKLIDNNNKASQTLHQICPKLRFEWDKKSRLPCPYQEPFICPLITCMTKSQSAPSGCCEIWTQTDVTITSESV